MAESVSARSASPQPPAPQVGGRFRSAPHAAFGPTYGALSALVLLVALNALLTPNFATASNLWNVLLQVSTVLLVAVGLTFVIATRGVDLSV